MDLFKQGALVVWAIIIFNCFVSALFFKDYFYSFYGSYLSIILDVAFTWGFIYIYTFGLFYAIRKIYCSRSFIFNSIKLIIAVTILVKSLFAALFVLFLKNQIYYQDIAIALVSAVFVMIVAFIYICILALLARLIFKGFSVDYPVDNKFSTRLLKVLHVACLIADLTIIGAFLGVPMFLLLWVLQYIFANEKNPFFAFRVYKPKID